mgnify:CR=1 FL=1
MGQGTKTTSLPRAGDAEATTRLRQSGALGAYGEIVDALATPAAVLSPAGLIVAVNRGLAEHLQVAPETLLGEPLLAFIARSSERTAFGRAFTGLRQRPAGHAFSLELTLVPARGRSWPCSVRTCRLASDHALVTCEAPERAAGADVGRALTRCLEALDQGLLVLDAGGRIVHANPAARALLGGGAAPRDMSDRSWAPAHDSEGRAGAHLGGRSLLELADPADARALSEALTQARAGNWHGEVDLRRLDGEPLPVELSLAGGRDEGALTVALLRDLRERRLKAFEERLLAQVDRLLVSSARPQDNVAAACGAVIDSLGYARGVVLARVADGWQRWRLRSGYAPQVAVVPAGEAPPDAWAGEPGIAEVDLAAAEIRRTFGELEGCRSGVRVVLGAPPRLAGYLLLAGAGAGPRDPHAFELLALLAPQLALGLEGGRLMLETEALAAYQAQLLDQTSVLINSIDAAGRVVTWNRASQQLLGVAPAAARGRRFGVEVARLAEPARWDSLWATLQKTGTIAAEVAVLAEGGQEIPLHLEGRLLRAADDSVTGAVLVGLDLRRRRALEEQILRAQKLAAVGLLAAGIAHEINNPLSGVVGYSRLLLEKPLDPNVREKVEKIAASGERCRKIVEGVLLFSRQREGGKKRNVDLGGLLDRVLAIGEYQWRMHNVRILREGLPAAHVVGDADQLEQVLLNLLSNAVDAMPRGGRIRIRTGREDGRVRLEITDEGCGIPSEILGRIFDPFFSTKEIGKGTGLGLAISYGIIKDHGGDILVRSQPGSGSTFTILLPDALDGQQASV